MEIAAYCSVRLADGTLRRAEDVAPGDRLLAPGSAAAVLVRKVWSGPGVGMRHIAAGEMDLDLTGDQRVLTAGGWAPAETVRAGDRLLTADGEAICTEAEALDGTFMVYDIVPEPVETEEGGSLDVGGFVVGI